MTHAIAALQTSIVSALNADPALVALIGADAVFDMAPKGKTGPFIVIVRHDLIAHNTDLSPGNEHRLHLQVWHMEPSREKLLAMVDRVVAVMTSANLNSASLNVTNVNHQRCETAIDLKTGRARALVVFRLFSEPV